MGEAIAKLGWARHSYVISTKVFWGLHDEPNMKNTLNRKYLMQAIDGSLERLGLDFVDLLFCHRADPKTPIEETVWAMSDIVSSGKALYWGTSEWTADEIRAAWEIAERHHLHKPVMEQPQYNLLHRMRVEFEYARLYEDIGLGHDDLEPARVGSAHAASTSTACPTTPAPSCPATSGCAGMLTDPKTNEKVRKLKAVADDLGCTLAQLSLAWCTKNKRVSTVITGASKASQVHENMAALEVAERLDRDVMARIEEAVPFTA